MKRSPAKKVQSAEDQLGVDAYLASMPEPACAGLEKLRQAIATALPEATQGMSYGIPCFKLHGRPVVWFAGFSKHSSFFPGAAAIRIHAGRLKSYKTSKGTIQFPPDKPLPAALVARLIKTRVEEMQLPRKRAR